MKGKRQIRQAARRLFRFCFPAGQLDEARVLDVASGIVGSGKRESLAVLADFQRMVRLECERHRAVVESATPLPAELQDELRTNLTRLYGAGLDTSFREDPALIGGVRVRVGSDVYDGSVRGRLAAIDAVL